MAQPEALALAGPDQFGRRVCGRYVYWILMAYLTLETLTQKAAKTQDDFTHDPFTKLLVRVHATWGVPLEETMCFRYPHANGTPLHLKGHSHGDPNQQAPAQSAPGIQKTITLEPVLARVLVAL